MLKRFIGAVVEAAAGNELIRIEAAEARGRLTISATRPGSTVQLGETQMFDPSLRPATKERDRASASVSHSAWYVVWRASGAETSGCRKPN